MDITQSLRLCCLPEDILNLLIQLTQLSNTDIRLTSKWFRQRYDIIITRLDKGLPHMATVPKLPTCASEILDYLYTVLRHCRKLLERFRLGSAVNNESLEVYRHFQANWFDLFELMYNNYNCLFLDILVQISNIFPEVLFVAKSLQEIFAATRREPEGLGASIRALVRTKNTEAVLPIVKPFGLKHLWNNAIEDYAALVQEDPDLKHEDFQTVHLSHDYFVSEQRMLNIQRSILPSYQYTVDRKLLERMWYANKNLGLMIGCLRAFGSAIENIDSLDLEGLCNLANTLLRNEHVQLLSSILLFRCSENFRLYDNLEPLITNFDGYMVNKTQCVHNGRIVKFLNSSCNYFTTVIGIPLQCKLVSDKLECNPEFSNTFWKFLNILNGRHCFVKTLVCKSMVNHGIFPIVKDTTKVDPTIRLLVDVKQVPSMDSLQPDTMWSKYNEEVLFCYECPTYIEYSHDTSRDLPLVFGILQDRVMLKRVVEKATSVLVTKLTTRKSYVMPIDMLEKLEDKEMFSCNDILSKIILHYRKVHPNKFSISLCFTDSILYSAARLTSYFYYESTRAMQLLGDCQTLQESWKMPSQLLKQKYYSYHNTKSVLHRKREDRYFFLFYIFPLSCLLSENFEVISWMLQEISNLAETGIFASGNEAFEYLVALECLRSNNPFLYSKAREFGVGVEAFRKLITQFEQQKTIKTAAKLLLRINYEYRPFDFYTDMYHDL